MKVVLFSVAAMFFYAIANVILELKFSKYNNLTIMVCYSTAIFIVAIVGRQLTKTNDPSFAFPTGTALGLVVLLGISFAIADYFFVGAYTSGGSLLTITSITIMFPVFASGIKYMIKGGLPNLWEVAGYVTAFAAIALVTKGSMVK